MLLSWGYPGCAGQGRRAAPSLGDCLGLLGPAAAQASGAQRIFWKFPGSKPLPLAGLTPPPGFPLSRKSFLLLPQHLWLSGPSRAGNLSSRSWLWPVYPVQSL